MKKMYYLSALVLVLLFACSVAYAQTDTEYIKALEQYEKGNFSEAIKYLKDFVSRRPEPSAYYLIGYALYKQKKFDEAEEYFKQTYLIDPNFSPRSLEYFEKQSPEEMEALEQFARPTEEPEVEPAMPIEAAPPVAEAEPETAPMPEQAPPAVAQVAPPPQPTAPKQVAPPPQPTAPKQVAPPPQPTAPQQVAPPPQTTAPKQVQPRPSQQPRRPQQMPGQQFVPSFIAMFLGGFFLLTMIISGILYLFYALCLFMIARKLDVSMPWLAFIPIFQLWTLVASAGKSVVWLLVLISPVLGPAASFIDPFIGMIVSIVTGVLSMVTLIYLWMSIAGNLGKSKWLGFLMWIPGALLVLPTLIIMGILAFSKGGAARSMGDLSDFEGGSFDDSDLSSFIPPADDEDEDTF